MGFSLKGALSGGLSGFLSGGNPLSAGLGALAGGFGGGGGAGASQAAGGFGAGAGITAAERRQLRGDLEGYRGVGASGLSGLQRLLQDPSSIKDDPGYQFGRDEGLRGIMSQNTALGIGQSGGNLRDLTKFGSDYANKYRGDLINQYQGAAGLGLEGILGGGATGASLAGAEAGLLGRQGEYKGAGQVGERNALMGGLRDLAGSGFFSGNLSGGGGQQVGGGAQPSGGSFYNTPGGSGVNYSEPSPWENY